MDNMGGAENKQKLKEVLSGKEAKIWLVFFVGGDCKYKCTS